MCSSDLIEPLVTLSHYETPLSLVNRFGGWKDRKMIDIFVHYADIVMNHYKGKVKYWLTFNEINAMDMAPYMGGGLIDGSEQNRAQGAQYRTLFKNVSARHAYLEGEGDRSLAYWRKVHQAFFTAELAEVKLDFTPDLEVVCEEFEVIFS